MKLGIIIDSSSGLSKEESEKRGYGFLPLYININGKEYRDGIDISIDEFYSMIKIDDEIRTSATPPTLSEKIIKEFSLKNDYVLVYSISEHLSSQCNNLKITARKFKNVHVVSSNGVGHAIVKDVEELAKIANKEDYSWEIIKEYANKLTKAQYGVAIPTTMNWLVKGGRVNSTVAGMANLLKIIPIISFKNGSLDKFGKGRVFKKAIVKMSKKLKEEVGDDVEYIIYNGNNQNIGEYKKDIEKIIGKEIKVFSFPPVIGSNIGPNAVALISRKASKYK